MKRTSSTEAPVDDDLLPEYRFDYQKARPNRFAGRVQPGSRIVVLLTDGIPNRVPTPAAGGGQDVAVRAAAAALRDAGFTLFAVGLGRENAPEPVDLINSELLIDLAGDPARYFEEPSTGRLITAYDAIAQHYRCPSTSDWPP
jgi:hypothetical protein